MPFEPVYECPAESGDLYAAEIRYDTQLSCWYFVGVEGPLNGTRFYYEGKFACDDTGVVCGLNVASSDCGGFEFRYFSPDPTGAISGVYARSIYWGNTVNVFATLFASCITTQPLSLAPTFLDPGNGAEATIDIGWDSSIANLNPDECTFHFMRELQGSPVSCSVPIFTVDPFDYPLIQDACSNGSTIEISWPSNRPKLLLGPMWNDGTASIPHIKQVNLITVRPSGLFACLPADQALIDGINEQNLNLFWSPNLASYYTYSQNLGYIALLSYHHTDGLLPPSPAINSPDNTNSRWDFEIYYIGPNNPDVENDPNVCNRVSRVISERDKRFTIYQKSNFVLMLNAIHNNELTNCNDNNIGRDGSCRILNIQKGADQTP